MLPQMIALFLTVTSPLLSILPPMRLNGFIKILFPVTSPETAWLFILISKLPEIFPLTPLELTTTWPLPPFGSILSPGVPSSTLTGHSGTLHLTENVRTISTR
jgi:hypothetical protein